jgi:hypothetical protein
MNAVWKSFAVLSAAFLSLAAVTVAQAKGPKGGHAPRAVLAAVHADVTVIDAKGGTKTLTWDKGTVKAKSDTSITLDRKDGKSVTLAVNAQTKTRGTVEQGSPAVVFSSNNAATAILGAPDRANAPAAPKSENDRKHGGSPFDVPRGAVHVAWALVLPDGKAVAIALDRGEVTAKSDTSITLKRPDGASVTLKIDANTKVRAKDNAVKVGDRAEAVSQAGTALAIVAGPPKAA